MLWFRPYPNKQIGSITSVISILLLNYISNICEYIYDYKYNNILFSNNIK